MDNYILPSEELVQHQKQDWQNNHYEQLRQEEEWND